MLPGAGNCVCKSSVVRGNMGVEVPENQVQDWIETEFKMEVTQSPLGHAKSCLL